MDVLHTILINKMLSPHYQCLFPTCQFSRASTSCLASVKLNYDNIKVNVFTLSELMRIGDNLPNTLAYKPRILNTGDFPRNTYFYLRDSITGECRLYIR